ncbi:MAG: tyrosine-type recombinase/integrase [Thermodesulfovibrionales bacterium]|nr:tyrosine-type recombinase/integrase [Thermodesulfovibrionales bacterium]
MSDIKTDLKILHNDFCRYFSLEKGRTASTVRTYKANFNEFVRWLADKGLSSDVSTLNDYKVLRDFMYFLAERGLDKKTVRQRMLSLKSFCKYLLREDFLQRNPFDRFDIPKKEKNLPKPLSNNIRDRLVTALKRRYEKTKDVRDLQAVVMIELGLKAGFRKGAMRNLLWEKTDLKNGYVQVLDKGQKEKCYVMPPSVVHWLKLLKIARGSDRGHVILSPKSKTPISITSLHDEFKRYVRLSGLDDKEINLHRLRHTYGTNLYESGMDIRDVQEALGHDDISSTLGYVEVSKKNLREKIKRAFSNAK